MTTLQTAVTAASTTLQLGIPESMILAPIQPPPKKKRKSNDEFTILERLEILAELKGPHAVSVPNLAAKHRTSKTSIYRWKKDLPRLLKLSKKADGTEHKKRVPIVLNKRGGKRKSTSYHEEFSASQKLLAIRELSTGSDPPSVRTVASKIGVNYRALYRWKKDEQKLIQLVEQDGEGDRKRLINDPMGRVKEALKLFYMSQREQQQQQTKNVVVVVVVTGPILSLKAKQIRDEMLAQHEISPYLSESELKGMKEFTGSASWGRKLLHKFNSMVGGEGDDDNNMAAAGMITSTTTQQPQSQPWNATLLPPASKANTDPSSSLASDKQQQHQQQKIRDMKREISLLKKNLHRSELRVHELAMENAALRAQITSMTMMYGGSGDVGSCVTNGACEEEDEEDGKDAEGEDNEVDGGKDEGYKEYY